MEEVNHIIYALFGCRKKSGAKKVSEKKVIKRENE